MKELYNKPELNVDEFKLVDVLTESGIEDKEDEGWD